MGAEFRREWDIVHGGMLLLKRMIWWIGVNSVIPNNDETHVRSQLKAHVVFDSRSFHKVFG